MADSITEARDISVHSIAAQPVVEVPALAPDVNETSVVQHLDVVRDRGLADSEAALQREARQLVNSRHASNDRESCRVRQDLEELIQRNSRAVQRAPCNIPRHRFHPPAFIELLKHKRYQRLLRPTDIVTYHPVKVRPLYNYRSKATLVKGGPRLEIEVIS